MGKLRSVAYRLARGHASERGASMVEYALLLALLAIAMLGALQFFGESRTSAWEQIGSALP